MRMRLVPPLLGGAFLAWAAILPAQAQAPLAAQGCLGCHGPQGAGIGSVPGLAGRDQAELVAQMRAFRANERPGTIMGRIARGYTDAEIIATAAYFAQKPR
jgi:cytochrome subunit of sulfide dehydrogenase